MFVVCQSPQNEAVKRSSCGQCNVEDTAEMVQCDKCDVWYHFTCAGITDSVENHEWICSKCTGKPANVNDVREQFVHELTTMSAHSNRVTPANKDASERFIYNSKTMSILSCTSLRQRRINLELKRLDEEKELAERFLNRKYEILAMSDDDVDSVHSDVMARSEKVVPKMPHPSPWQIENDHLDSNSRYQTHYTNQGEIPKNCIQAQETAPTNIQLSARQVLSKELPIFSGKPEEWPLFFSSFVESTKLCGYSDAENLLRLQQCLKGKAFDAVSCHLLLPKNVPEVIRTLKMMFGRPEIIINTLLEKIRSETLPKADKLESLVSYAIAVRNLCATLEASGLEAHKNNPLLLQELVNKLPAQTKLNWAMHVAYIDADISVFSKWLFDIAEAITKVSPSIVSYKTNSYLHLHEIEQLPGVKDSCVLCDEIHPLEECDKFSKMNLSDRWDKVRQLRICRLCLKKHGNYRCSDAKCSVEGCDAWHHKLLHKYRMNPTVTTHSNPSLGDTTFFKIIPVTLHNNGITVETFAFLDDGSNVTLLEEDVSDQLGLKGEMKHLCLNWTSDTSRTEEDSMQVSVRISSRDLNSKKYDLAKVRTVKNLSLPIQSVTKHDLASYQHLKNLPLSTYNDAKPKVLIGLNNGYVCNTLKLVEGSEREPCASKTRLGWVIHGGGDASQLATLGYHRIMQCHCNHQMEKLQKIVSDYLSLENVGRKNELLSAEYMGDLQTTTKCTRNRFETELLWKKDHEKVPNNFPILLKQVECFETKLDSQHLQILNQQIDTSDDETKWKKRFNSDMQSQCFGGPTFLKQHQSQRPPNNLKESKLSEELRPHIIMLHLEVGMKNMNSKQIAHMVLEGSKQSEDFKDKIIPLEYNKLDENLDKSLTPNNFTWILPNDDKQLGEFSKDDNLLRKDCGKVQHFTDVFWKRWIKKYYPSLTKRTKWVLCNLLQVSDVFIIVGPNLPRKHSHREEYNYFKKQRWK